MKLREELAFDGADDMHDMRVTLDGHQLFDFDRAVFADAAYVIAAEIDEHDVLGSRRAGGFRQWDGTGCGLDSRGPVLQETSQRCRCRQAYPSSRAESRGTAR